MSSICLSLTYIDEPYFPPEEVKKTFTRKLAEEQEKEELTLDERRGEIVASFDRGIGYYKGGAYNKSDTDAKGPTAYNIELVAMTGMSVVIRIILSQIDFRGFDV